MEVRKYNIFSRSLAMKRLCLFLGCLLLTLSCQRSMPVAEIGPPTVQPTIVQNPSSPPSSRDVPQLPSVNRDRLWNYLTQLASERASESQRQTTRAILKEILTQNGWQVEQQAFSGGINLIAHQTPIHKNTREILVGAHYDTIAGSPGADDNATGIAALLELSHIFQNYSSTQQLTLAFFDLEENGVIGSAAYANEPQNLTQLQSVIILEMLGYTCFNPGCQTVPPELNIQPPSDVGDFLSIIGDQEHPELLKIFEQNNPSSLKLFTLEVPFKGLLTPILLRSDHTPFWLKGIGAVMVSDTAFLRNPHYHQRSDTPATLDPEFLSDSTQLVAQAVAALIQ